MRRRGEEARQGVLTSHPRLASSPRILASSHPRILASSSISYSTSSSASACSSIAAASPVSSLLQASQLRPARVPYRLDCVPLPAVLVPASLWSRCRPRLPLSLPHPMVRAGERNLGRLGCTGQSRQRSQSMTWINRMFLHKPLGQEINQSLIKIVAAKLSVPMTGPHFHHTAV